MNKTNKRNKITEKSFIVKYGLRNSIFFFDFDIMIKDDLETIVNDQNEAMNNYSKMMEAAINFPPLASVASVYLKMKTQNTKNSLSEPGNVKSDTVSII